MIKYLVIVIVLLFGGLLTSIAGVLILVFELSTINIMLFGYFWFYLWTLGAKTLTEYLWKKNEPSKS